MDALLLRLAGAILGRYLSLGRLAAFSALGAALALGALYGPAFLVSLPAKAVTAGIMAFAFPWAGWRKYGEGILGVLASACVVGGGVLAFTLALGGTIQGGAVLAPVPLRAALLGAVVAAMIPTAVRRFRAKRAYAAGAAALRVRVGKKDYSLSAIRDSGCALMEPLTGLPVIPAYLPELAPLARIPVPAAVINGKTTLFALRPEAVFVDGLPVEALLAPLCAPISGADAVIPCQITKERV